LQVQQASHSLKPNYVIDISRRNKRYHLLLRNI